MKVAGGLLRDMTIHDFDLARFMLGEEPVEVAAFANALIAREVQELGDHDTAMILLRTANGRQCCTTNYRKATYGYDQRIEAVGELGMLKAENCRATTVERWDGRRTEAKDPILHFFIERYREAYVLELDDFIDALEQGRPCDPGFRGRPARAPARQRGLRIDGERQDRAAVRLTRPRPGAGMELSRRRTAA
jgi:myo-inositol 2-dehydrogenase / D-chiro-inositol 1-dehydrogenase